MLWFGAFMMDRDNYEAAAEPEMVDMDIPVIRRRLRPERRTHRPLSRVLGELAARDDVSFTIADLRDALADRSFATLLFFFAAINLLPMPPGTSAFLGLPPLLIAAQMIVGQQKVWLPHFILKRPVTAARFRQMVEKMSPWMRKLERVVKPRYWLLPTAVADRFIGVIAFFLSVLLVAPIPLGNWLPALAIALLGLALSERDGVLLGAAFLATIAAVVAIGAILGSAGYLASMLM